MKTSDLYGIRAVERAFLVLRVLRDASGPCSLPSIASASGLSVTTTYRLLRTLESEGVVETHDQGYTLGVGVLELADAFSRQQDVIRVARPYLASLRDELNETCGLGVRSGDSWVTVAHMDSAQPVRRVMRAGERLSLAATATGRVFLAYDDDAEVERYITRHPEDVSDEQAGGPDELRAQLREIRERGYAWVTNAKNTGGWGVRHPVFRHDGQIVAVVSVACPRDRFTDEFRDRCLEASQRLARQISTALGYSGSAIRLRPGSGAAEPPRVAALAGPAI